MRRKRSETREILLQQHDRLRELMAAAQAAAQDLLAGRLAGGDFPRALTDLREALAEHNVCEEAVLEPLLEADPTVGPLRVKRMFEEHTAEHAAFRAALTGDAHEVAARMEDLAEDLDAHMAAEERTFLSPAVLKDDPADTPRR